MAQSNVVSDVGQSSGGLGTAVAAAIVQFNKAAVMPSLITMSAAPAGTTTVRFPVYTKHDVTHADYGVKNMADAAEDTIANLTNIETTAVDCKVLRNAIRAEITDLAAYGNADALLTNAGRQLGNDMNSIQKRKKPYTLDCAKRDLLDMARNGQTWKTNV